MILVTTVATVYAVIKGGVAIINRTVSKFQISKPVEKLSLFTSAFVSALLIH